MEIRSPQAWATFADGWRDVRPPTRALQVRTDMPAWGSEFTTFVAARRRPVIGLSSRWRSLHLTSATATKRTVASDGYQVCNLGRRTSPNNSIRLFVSRMDASFHVTWRIRYTRKCLIRRRIYEYHFPGLQDKPQTGCNCQHPGIRISGVSKCLGLDAAQGK